MPSYHTGRLGTLAEVRVENTGVFLRETSLTDTLTPYRLARNWFAVASTAASFTFPCVCSLTSVAAAAHSGSRLQKNICTLKRFNSWHRYFSWGVHVCPGLWKHTWTHLCACVARSNTALPRFPPGPFVTALPKSGRWLPAHLWKHKRRF